MKYLLVKGYIGYEAIIELDRLLSDYEVSMLPCPHLGLYGDSIILKAPEFQTTLINILKEKFPKTKFEEIAK